MFSKRILISTTLIAVAYLLFATYLMNINLIESTIFGLFPLSYKLRLLFVLLGGMWTAMTHTGLFLLLATSLLTGANISLLFQRIKSLRKNGKMHIVVGGSSLLGVVGSGCVACGLPIISFLGLSGSLIYLPFHGTEISYVAVGLLATSLFVMLRSSSKKSQVCTVEKRKIVPIVQLAMEGKQI